MPIVSIQQAFTAFGFSPAQAARMAAAKSQRAANGLNKDFGNQPDELEGDQVDILDLAEEDRKQGNLQRATEILVFALASCKGNATLAAVELKAHVKLAHVYHEMKEFAKASREFQQAYELHQHQVTDEVCFTLRCNSTTDNVRRTLK